MLNGTIDMGNIANSIFVYLLLLWVACRVPELERDFEIKELPGEENGGFTTLGGFVVSHIGRIPSAGDSFEVGSRRYEVMDMDRNRVDKVLVSEVAPPQEDGERREESSPN